MMTQQIALQLEQAKADYIDSWFQSMQANTSFEIAILRVKNVRAFATRHLQAIGLFNHGIGLGSQNGELLEPVMRFYEDHGVATYHSEVNPYHASSAFLAALTAHGFFLSRFETYVWELAPFDLPGFSTPVSIREITPSEIELFATLHVNTHPCRTLSFRYPPFMR